MRWVKHYKRKKSNAHPIIKRMKKREDMAKKRQTKEKRKAKRTYDIPPEKYFTLCDGSHIKSIEELALMLDKINDDDFSFHVNEEKNDFSNWIRDVFGKRKLADSLYPIRNKKESQIFLLKHALSKKQSKTIEKQQIQTRC